MTAAVSVFAFDPREKFRMAMTEIHNTNVPGWKLQLQTAMNKIFAAMAPDSPWYRHNWLFQDYPEVLHPYFPWTPLVVGRCAIRGLPALMLLVAPLAKNLEICLCTHRLSGGRMFVARPTRG